MATTNLGIPQISESPTFDYLESFHFADDRLLSRYFLFQRVSFLHYCAQIILKLVDVDLEGADATAWD